MEQINKAKVAAPTGSLKIKTNTIPAEYDVFDETATPKFSIGKDYLHMITGVPQSISSLTRFVVLRSSRMTPTQCSFEPS